MGWNYLHVTKGTKVEEIFKKEFEYTNETKGSYTKVIACKSTPTEAYLAIDCNGDVYGLVCLINRRKNEYCNFGYKSIDEYSHPYYYNTPKSILDLLTPTLDDNANTWREKCYENIARNEQKKALVFGDNIKFDKPVSFGKYGKCSTFQVDNIKKGHFFANELGIMIKLNKAYINNNTWSKI